MEKEEAVSPLVSVDLAVLEKYYREMYPERFKAVEQYQLTLVEKSTYNGSKILFWSLPYSATEYDWGEQ